MGGRNKLAVEVRAENIRRSKMKFKARRDADNREMSAAKRASGVSHATKGPRIEDLKARLAEIPADTRGLTARIAGDPLPGRSALDRLSQHKGA